MFSDIAISFIIEMEENKVDSFYDHLKNSLTMNDFQKSNSILQNDCTVLLNVTFIKGTGDLRIETPVVPG